MITGAQAMVKALEAEGVRVLFGYPGAAICPFIDALEGSAIKQILVRQEQNAGHSASGYARMTGKPGICVVTSGPGATNLITGLATAYMDSIPIVAISGQVRSDLIGRDVFQEADITGAAEPFIKHSYLVKEAEDLPRVFKEAFYIASTGRPGPVLIDVPVDIQQKSFDFRYPDQVDIKGYKPRYKGHIIQLKKVAEAIAKAKRPVICAGGGIFASSAQAELQALAERYRIPVVTTMMGIGSLPSRHPLNLGMLGSHGVKSANRAIHEADLLIIIGARVGDRAMAETGQITAKTRVVHIDIDPAEIGKNMQTEIPIVGDAKQILSNLIEMTAPGDTAEWLAYIENLKTQNSPLPAAKQGFTEPRSFIRKLSDKMSPDSVLVADVGQNQIWSANHFEVRSGRFLTSGGMGTMGYSIPAALGVKLAEPDRQVVAVCGDGSFQMSMMELGTACQYGLGLKIVVMRNQCLGMVREIQARLYGKRYLLTDLNGNPDTIALAAAYGIPALRVTDQSEAAEAIEKMLSADGLFLLECVVDADEGSL